MFSYYDKGCKAIAMDKVISIEDLVTMIRENKKKDEITYLRSLSYRSDKYDSIKLQLPCITPAGVFLNARTKAGIFQTSGYLFFDIDYNDINVPLSEYRNQLLEEYKDYISLLCTSVGGKGLSIYAKVNNASIDNYEIVYEYLRTEIFGKIKIDNNAKGINRPHIIPYDSDLYYIEHLSIEIDKETFKIPGIKKIETSYIKKDKKGCFIGKVTFIPIGEVLSTIVLSTKVDVGDMLFKIERVPYYEVFVPRIIKDGRKHATFRAITQGLLFLNPYISLLTVQSYINFINHNNTVRPMITREMLSTVEHAYNKSKLTGAIDIPIKLKSFHINRNATLSREERRSLASKINGLIRIRSSVEKITAARKELSEKGVKITQSSIAKTSGLSLRTVVRYINTIKEDIDIEIDSYNEVTF